MKQITAYRCDHCRRVMVTPRAMKTHEAQCIRNPGMRTCATCEHNDTQCRHLPRGERIEIECAHWEPAEGYATD